MADAKKLKRFHVEAEGDAYRIDIEDDGGNVLNLEATRDQLDVIVDTLDDILSQDDEADEVDDED